jgi:sugar phosphate isomerase/epimerase
MNNPILVSTIAYDGYDLGTTLEAMAAAGVENVELAYSEAYTAPVTEDNFSKAAADSVRAALKASGLRCPCLAAHTDMSLPTSVDKFKRRIDFAGYLGAEYIVSTAGPIANRDQFLKNIRPLGEYAARAGVTICLENMGDGRPNIIDSAAPAVELIDEINLSSVKINYDFANLLPHCSERLRPEDDYKIALPRAGYFHVKDVAKDENGNWYFPAIGAGTIDFKSILPALAAHPEPIPLSLELSLRITRLPDATPIRAEASIPLETIGNVLKESLQFVKSFTNHQPGTVF